MTRERRAGRPPSRVRKVGKRPEASPQAGGSNTKQGTSWTRGNRIFISRSRSYSRAACSAGSTVAIDDPPSSRAPRGSALERLIAPWQPAKATRTECCTFTTSRPSTPPSSRPRRRRKRRKSDAPRRPRWRLAAARRSRPDRRRQAASAPRGERLDKAATRRQEPNFVRLRDCRLTSTRPETAPGIL